MKALKTISSSMNARCFAVCMGMALILGLFTIAWSSQAMAADLELNDQSGGLGSSITYTLSVNNTPNPVSSLNVDVEFDQTTLQYEGADFSGTLMEDFAMKLVNPSEGVLHAGGITTNPIPAGSSGDLVKLTFTVIGDQNHKLTLSALLADINGWTTKDGSFGFIGLSIQPASATLSLGGKVEFKVEPENLGTPPFTWRVDGVEVQTGDSRTLNYEATKAGKYTIAVEDADGQLAEATATVEEGIELMIEPSLVSLCVGAKIALTVAPEGAGIPPFSWYVDGVEVQADDSPTFTYEATESGEYTITMEDSAGKSAEATATVKQEDNTGSLDIPGKVAPPGGTVTIPVRIQDAPEKVSALGFDVLFDPKVLTFEGAYFTGTLLDDFDHKDVIELADGRLRVAGFTTSNAIAMGTTGNVVYLTFGANYQECTASTLDLADLVDHIAGWSASGGHLLGGCGCDGDVNRDGSITPLDALSAFEKYLSICPTTSGIPCEEVCCDVTGEKECTPLDALCMFKKYLELPGCLD
ncbi:MAG: hypothetical protein JSU72_15585 [Deltaproteobacteria bacterium]|nr:MAG: hypothetical protein JSU72_15585 [Deltaproteobacteria bacterium]